MIWVIPTYQFQIRFLRPGTLHVSLALEDCIGVGSNFYSKETFSDSLHAVALERHLGGIAGLRRYPASPIILFKLLHHYVMELEKPLLLRGWCFHLMSNFFFERLWTDAFPAIRHFAALVVLVMHMDMLQSSADGIMPVWQHSDFFVSDFAYARKVATQLFDLKKDDGFKIEMQASKGRLMKIYGDAKTIVFRQCFWKLLR